MYKNIKLVTDSEISNYEKAIISLLSTSKEEDIDKKIEMLNDSEYKCLIFDEKKLIGYLNLIRKNEKNFYVNFFLDEKYRNQGIGSYAFECLKIISHLQEFIIFKEDRNADTKNEIVNSLCFQIHQTNESSYYLMQYEKISKFFDSKENIYLDFIKLCDDENKRQKIKIRINVK